MGFPDARPIPLLASLSDWLANQKLLGTEVPTHRNPGVSCQLHSILKHHRHHVFTLRGLLCGFVMRELLDFNQS